MIALDSSHPFDWPGFRQSIERELSSLLAQLDRSEAPRSREILPLEADVAQYGRQLPESARLLLQRDFRSLGQRYGVGFVDVEALRHALQGIDGIARLLGEAFVPVFHIGDGVTASVYLPSQVESCADSFVVLADELLAGFEFGAFSLGMFLMDLAAIVYSVRKGNPARLGRSVPPLLREWLL
jgi:hypothetical protein